MGVGADAVYRINKYHIYTQDWYWPLRKRITKKLRKEKMHKESITEELGYDQWIICNTNNQASLARHTEEESEISEFSRACKTNYELPEFQLNIITQNQGLTPTIHILRGKEGEPRTLTNKQTNLARHTVVGLG